jgi:hypothetical protein
MYSHQQRHRTPICTESLTCRPKVLSMALMGLGYSLPAEFLVHVRPPITGEAVRHTDQLTAFKNCTLSKQATQAAADGRNLSRCWVSMLMLLVASSHATHNRYHPEKRATIVSRARRREQAPQCGVASDRLREVNRHEHSSNQYRGAVTQALNTPSA